MNCLSRGPAHFINLVRLIYLVICTIHVSLVEFPLEPIRFKFDTQSHDGKKSRVNAHAVTRAEVVSWPCFMKPELVQSD